MVIHVYFFPIILGLGKHYMVITMLAKLSVSLIVIFSAILLFYALRYIVNQMAKACP